jgi:Alpha/beta hydrolase family
MSTFGLVHGGGLGAWCWDALGTVLHALGKATVTVDLSPDDFGGGALHCARVVSDRFAGLPDLVLVGHSVSVLFLPLATLSVSRLVFLHALLPRPGMSVVDQLKVESDMFDPELFTAKAPFWEDESIAREFLFHDCDPKVASEAFRRLQPEP